MSHTIAAKYPQEQFGLFDDVKGMRTYRIVYTYSDKCIVTTGSLEVEASSLGEAERVANETLRAWRVRVLAIDTVSIVR